ncbi:hypothetical protein HDU82_007291 [Entophlyctis luteolus]|nr:hypothetical protein HDU82_007291 [Entophlyctis luteolus]
MQAAESLLHAKLSLGVCIRAVSACVSVDVSAQVPRACYAAGASRHTHARSPRRVETGKRNMRPHSPPKNPPPVAVPFSYAGALLSRSPNGPSSSSTNPAVPPAHTATAASQEPLPMRVPLVDQDTSIPPSSSSPLVSSAAAFGFAVPASAESPVSPQSPSSPATAATPSNWPASHQFKLSDNAADFSSDAKTLNAVGPQGQVSSLIQHSQNWSSVASPPRRQSVSFPQTPVNDYRLALSEQFAGISLGGGGASGNSAAPIHIDTATFEDDDDLVLSRKRNIRMRTASTPNAMMGIPPSTTAFLENYNHPSSNWGSNENVSGSNTWIDEVGSRSSIWNGGNGANSSVSQAKQHRSLSFSFEPQHSSSQASLERRSSFVQEEDLFQQQLQQLQLQPSQQSRPRTPIGGVPIDHIPLQNDTDFAFSNGRARSKSSGATTAYPASQYLATSPNNQSNLDPMNSIWSNNESSSVNAILHRRASTQPSIIDSRWGGGAATDSVTIREPLRNDDEGFLGIGGLDSERYRRRHSHAPNLYAELSAQLVSRPSDDSDWYDARRRHSLGGPPLYTNYMNDLEASYNTKTDPSLIYEEINDYFENTEHRTKAWVEAGKNLQKQTAFASDQQAFPSSSHQYMPQSFWPVYVVEFKAGRIDYFHAADATHQGIRKGDLVIVEADRGKDLGKVAHDGLANAAQLQFFQSQHKDIMVESLISGREIHPKRIYSLAQANEIALLVSKAQDEAKAVADLFKLYKTRIWMCAVDPTKVPRAF